MLVKYKSFKTEKDPLGQSYLVFLACNRKMSNKYDIPRGSVLPAVVRSTIALSVTESLRRCLPVGGG